jgi:hypothetical protein
MGSLGSIYAGGGSSAPATLPEYLASIGKDSWYATFEVGTDLWTGTNGTGSNITLDSSTNVGSWVSQAANTKNFSAYWTTSGGATQQPFYKTLNGRPAIVGTGNSDGTGDQRYMLLSSATALNGPYSALFKVAHLYRDNKSFYSHNGTAVYMQSSSGGGSLLGGLGANAVTVADQITHVGKNAPGASSGICVFGISQPHVSAHNGFAPYLCRRLSTYGQTAISKVCFTPLLAADELDVAMTYL